MRAVAFGLAVGAGIQAWRQWPADGPVTATAVFVVFVVGLVCAFLGGLWGGRGRAASATAVAVASADATAVASGGAATVNLYVASPAAEPVRPVGVQVPSESVAWLEGPRPSIEADDLDGFDLLDAGFEVEAPRPAD